MSSARRKSRTWHQSLYSSKNLLRHFGPELQVNYVDAGAMKPLRPNPHQDLVVRIAGYCEYFVNLDYKLQNEIIRRTLHEAM